MLSETLCEDTEFTAYDGGYDEDSDRYHQPIEVPPPSRIFIVCFVHWSKSVLEILADRGYACATFRALELLIDCWFWR